MIEKIKKGYEGYAYYKKDGILNLLNKKWVLLIICAIREDEILRFHQFKWRLIQINSNTLASRLDLIAKFGLIKRKFFSKSPPRTDYFLTEKGKELRKRIIPLLEWVDLYNREAEREEEMELEREKNEEI